MLLTLLTSPKAFFADLKASAAPSISYAALMLGLVIDRKSVV